MQETWVQFLGREDPPGEEMANPFQRSGLGDPMDRGAWRAAAHGVAKSWTRLSTHTPVAAFFLQTQFSRVRPLSTQHACGPAELSSPREALSECSCPAGEQSPCCLSGPLLSLLRPFPCPLWSLPQLESS